MPERVTTDSTDQLGVQRLLDIVRAINGLQEALTAGFAPVDAPLVTFTADATLTSSRVLTDSTTIDFTTAVSGQVSGSVIQSFDYAWTGSQTWTKLLDISSATAGQIKFPASQNASANANTLDDYEEGTFDPGMTFGGSATGVTYTSRGGAYTKIGNAVSFTLFVVLSNNGSGTGAAQITDLPFTSSSTLSPSTLGVTASALGIGVTSVAATVTPNAKTCDIYSFAAGSLTPLNDTTFPDTGIIYLSGVYYV